MQVLCCGKILATFKRKLRKLRKVRKVWFAQFTWFTWFTWFTHTVCQCYTKGISRVYKPKSVVRP